MLVDQLEIGRDDVRQSSARRFTVGACFGSSASDMPPRPPRRCAPSCDRMLSKYILRAINENNKD